MLLWGHINWLVEVAGRLSPFFGFFKKNRKAKLIHKVIPGETNIVSKKTEMQNEIAAQKVAENVQNTK